MDINISFLNLQIMFWNFLFIYFSYMDSFYYGYKYTLRYMDMIL